MALPFYVAAIPCLKKELRKVILLAFLTYGTLIQAQTNVSGPLATNTTWTTAGSPYTVTAQLTVNAGVTLTIEPGVQVLMNSVAIQVNGVLEASDASFAQNGTNPNAWNISVNNGGQATFENCSMAGGNQINTTAGGTSTLNNCALSNFAYASSGTLHVVGGAVTKPSGTAITISGGTNSFNGLSISNSTTGLTLATGSTTIQALNISGTTYPIQFTAVASLISNGEHTIIGNTHNAARVTFTTLGSNWTMPSLPIPWWLNGNANFTVNNGTVWTIASNNIIKIDDSRQIIINGKIIADAALDERIVFTNIRDDNQGGDTNANGSANAPSVGIWQGLRFTNNGDPTSSLTRCTFTYAGQSGTFGAVDVNTIAPTIAECTFQLNHFGITLRNGSQASIQNCTIGSSSSTPIAMTMDCNPQFLNNTFSFIDNQFDAIGLFATTLTADNTIIQRNVTGINNITYVMLGGITIPTGRTLTIQPGIVIKAAGFNFMVAGTLNMNGTALEPITFTSISDDNVGNPGDTNKNGNATLPTGTGQRPGGIGVNTGATLNMQHVTMRFCTSSASVFGTSTSNSNPFVGGWMVFDKGGSANITDCTFSDGTYGYEGTENAQAVFNNVNFTNLSQIPIAIQAPANPTFTNVVFTNVGLRALGIIGGTVTVNGALEQRTLAGYTNITQVLINNLTVASGAQLDIQPGVVLKLGSSANNIDVNGRFRILGTAEEPVIVTTWQDDAYGNPADTNEDGGATVPSAGNWLGIRFNSTADDAFNVIQHAMIRFPGNSSNDPGSARGAITFNNAGGTVTNTTIWRARYGLAFIGNSDPSINSTSIDGCTADAMAQTWEAQPILSNITLGSQNFTNGIRLLNATLVSDVTIGPAYINGVGHISYLPSSLTVATGATLTILPGTKFKWQNSWIINGSLVAVGTAQDPIIFTSIHDDSVTGDTNNNGNSTVPNMGNGGLLIFNATSNSSLNHLKHCSFRYGSTSTGSTQTGFMAFHSSGGVVENCEIEFIDGSPFYITGTGAPVIQDNFINNANGAPVRMHVLSNPTFSGNQFHNMLLFAIELLSETFTTSATFPLRSLNGFDPIIYYVHRCGPFFSVTNNAQITIPAGMVFKTANCGSNHGVLFHVSGGGRLMIQGTSEEPVIFTNLSDDSVGQPFDTDQNGNTTPGFNIAPSGLIRFEGTSDDASIVEGAIFRSFTHAVWTVNARPTIRNNTIEGSTYGIVMTGTEGAFIPNNTFINLTQTPVLTSILNMPDSTQGTIMLGTTKKMIGLLNETLLQDWTLEKRAFGDIENIPYYLPSSNFTVGTNATLTIAPGVVWKFGNNARLIVSRGISALGGATADSTIVFTHEADDYHGGDSNSNGPSTPGTWSGITIENEAVDASCNFSNCVIRYANSTTYGGIRCNSSSPTITRTRFQHCNQGVRAEGLSNPVINWCDFQNITGHAVNNASQTFNIDAKNCYWGTPTGPTHSGNPGGTGMTVTNQVDYMPFQTGPNAPLMGDVSLNGTVTAFDASQVLQYTVGLLPLTPQQMQVAEVSGNGTVTAYDASLILQFTVGLINTFPAQMSTTGGAAPQKMQIQFDPAALIMESVQAAPGDTFTVDLSLADVVSLYSLDAQLSYDASLLQLIGVETLLPLSFSAIHSMDTPGVVQLSAASAFPMTGDGAAFRLTFIAGQGILENITTLLQPVQVLVDEVDVTSIAVAGEIMIMLDITTSIPLPADVAVAGIYPNPATDGFTVVWPGITHIQPVEVQLFDNAGRLVFDRVIRAAEGARGAEFRIERNDIGHEISGVLFLRLSQNGDVLWNRVVLQ